MTFEYLHHTCYLHTVVNMKFQKLLVFLAGLGYSKNSLSISAVGDWGGTDEQPHQNRWGLGTAASISRLSESRDTDYVLLNGDNFYSY